MKPNDPSVISVVESSTAKPKIGRPKGSPNRNTETTRFMISQMVNALMPSAYAALVAIRDGTPRVVDARTGAVLSHGTSPNPKGFIDALQSIMEFNLPRLARVEVSPTREPDDVVIGKDVTPDEAERLYLKMVGHEPEPIPEACDAEHEGDE